MIKNETKQDDDQDQPTAFQRFQDFARRLIAVPKREIDEQEKKAKEG